MNDNFYVYSMLDPRKVGKYVYDNFEFNYEPFYIGKGKGDRIKCHFNPSRLNKPHRRNSKIKKLYSLSLKPIIEKIKENLDEFTAMNMEQEYITTIGRIDLGTGPLTNMTNGGEGMSGYICKEATRKKRSKSLKGRVPWNKGVKYSDVVKVKMSKTAIACGAGKHMLGRKLTVTHKQNIAEGLRGHSTSKSTILKISKSNIGKHFKHIAA